MKIVLTILVLIVDSYLWLKNPLGMDVDTRSSIFFFSLIAVLIVDAACLVKAEKKEDSWEPNWFGVILGTVVMLLYFLYS